MNQSFDRSVLIEADVKDALREGGDVAVLLYPQVADPKATFVPDSRGSERPVLREVQPRPLDQVSADEQLVAQLKEALEKITGKEVVYLSSAAAFSLTIDSDSFKRIVPLEGIASIRLAERVGVDLQDCRM